MGWLACRKQGQQSRAELLDWAFRVLRSGLTSRHHLTWEVRDPMPTLHLYMRKLIDVVQRRLPPTLRPAPRLPPAR
jgi:hypothetical protein